MPSDRTDIARVGEFALIERLRKVHDSHTSEILHRKDLVVGNGDDAAAFLPGASRAQVVTTDIFIEGIHFDLTFTSLKHVGWKAMAANLSDIAAMAATPRFALVSLALPAKVSVEMAEELYTGISLACKSYSCVVVGGDTSATLGQMVVSVTVIGEGDQARLLRRNGARPGDLVCVSGHLGYSQAGLRILQREKKRFVESPDPDSFRPNLAPYAPAIEKHLMPKPRFDISGLFSQKISARSMIDISDGLASEVHRLCEASGTGAKIYEHNLPVDTLTQTIAHELGESPILYALYGGEEYELLFSLSDEEYEKLESLTSDVTIIGRITAAEEGIQFIRENGEAEPLKPGGWDHFHQPTQDTP